MKLVKVSNQPIPATDVLNNVDPMDEVYTIPDHTLWDSIINPQTNTFYAGVPLAILHEAIRRKNGVALDTYSKKIGMIRPKLTKWIPPVNQNSSVDALEAHHQPGIVKEYNTTPETVEANNEAQNEPGDNHTLSHAEIDNIFKITFNEN